MHAMPPRRKTAAKLPEDAAGPALPEAFRSALGASAGKPPVVAETLTGASSGLKPGSKPQKGRKINTPPPARNLTLAPRKGHR